MMITKRLIVLFLFAILVVGGYEMAIANESKLPQANDVHLAPNAIGMPVGRFVLIRKDNDCCAAIFTRNWGKANYEQHAEYESYYQDDETGNFNSKNVQYIKEEVYYKKPVFSIFGHGVSIGAKLNIRYGPIELWWSAGPQLTFIYYNRADQNQRDYGYELAPTPWADISQVNIFDPRMKWYR